MKKLDKQWRSRRSDWSDASILHNLCSKYSRSFRALRNIEQERKKWVLGKPTKCFMEIPERKSIDGLSETFFFWYFPFKRSVMCLDDPKYVFINLILENCCKVSSFIWKKSFLFTASSHNQKTNGGKLFSGRKMDSF